MIERIIEKLNIFDKNKLDNFYCAVIGGTSGLVSFFHEIGIDGTFIGILIKTAAVAVVSTVFGLIVKQIWYFIFPKKGE